MDSPKPWERRNDESAPAFEAFAAYRDMPATERSYRDVARQLGKSATLIARWGSTHKWPERVAAYDRHLEEQWLLEQAKARRKAAERQIRTAQLAQSKAAQRLLELDPAKLTVAELVRLWELGVRVERDAMTDLHAGTTSKVEVTEDGGRLQVALTRFRELPPEQRRTHLAELAQDVARRARAAGDEDDDGE
ncbi:hypothetical protein F5972_08395 [Microbispora cellulosiformans]|uniref:Terminase small subunit n=1 Tax=Microbispora cellulosiformans TaxID=2614688 RepID=A0A5J5K5B5_9ACTN|nr:hypothetical protein [Microbispora cellulosiformans]KAA9379662.1 hypothetical protein F5972_08395 [Microbispora cellulosiformans]